MGRWDKLKGRYQVSPLDGDQKYIAKVDEARLQYGHNSLKDLISAFACFREEKAGLNDQIKELNVNLEALSQLIIAQLEAQDLHSVKTEAGQTLFITVEPQASVSERDKFEAHITSDPALDYLWSVNYQNLNSLVKSLLEEGKDDQVPPGLSIFLRTKVSLRKS